ncbi:Transcriptional regulator, LysR family [Klebsiella pneumoniae IS46]|uniref:Transcriptional regulator, LysR family n=1 Tax=Klebsiella pneumoniae IS43 TaxID=1432552 RepID=W1DK76_KLEPN|nr:Transcriptional regulator, LysR family [Klebsiella pneumoniae IS43]CDL17684.1 Transcriptional regulator, LysR family [Klebsiella pneumoniae IS46]CDL20340.1 Transcriptional regulator, LysR family [Klebsiella pneumoniae IS53]CDL64529.1 Transcriptional regulator, LysR family [Klebsiella pneumoniae IS39]
MQDLNDFAWFVQVVDHGGFAAAGRALDQPKSKLSRRIAQLEERLGVRLIQRTTPSVRGHRGRADLLSALQSDAD